MYRRLLFTVLASAWLTAVDAAVLVSTNSTWHYWKGFSEASSPDTAAWRAVDFSDSAWPVGASAFYYENSPSSANAFTGNTKLTDMFGGYTCIFLRQTFVVSNINDIAELQIAALSDDGFLAWINGHEIARFNMPDGSVAYNGTSRGALAEPIPWWTNSISDLQSFLLPGTNILAVQAFNCNLGNSSDFIIHPALYYTRDQSAPVLTLQYPAPGATVRQLHTIEVAFSEPVAGVEAADLLINGQPATNLTVVSPSQFVFGFAPVAAGPVQISWATAHGIRDLSSASNSFSATAWSYTVDPSTAAAEVVISEFMASNSGTQASSVHDELGNSPDWIELYNSSPSAISLTGWFLTDKSDKPNKWQFPATLLPARSYLLVLASGRDTNVLGQLHMSFKLSDGGGFLALVDPSGTVVSAYSPTYPSQYADISFGRDLLDPSLVGYYATPTPGTANTSLGAGFGPEVQFSRAAGTFLTDFSLVLSTPDTNCDIRYVLVTTNVASGAAALTNVPTSASTLYTAPIPVNNTVQVRARAFPRDPAFWPGPPRTESYIKLVSAAAAFSSDLPVIVLHNLAGGTVPQTTDQNVIVMVFEPVDGRTSLTNPPTLVARAGFNIRGSSTAGLPQSSFALELWDEYNSDRKLEFLGLPAESDWVLYGQDGFDPSCLHNPLMHQLSRDAGRYSSRTRFAEVFLNTTGGPLLFSSPAAGNYFGLYTVEEKIKRGPDRVDIKKLGPELTTMPAISGGYILKIDRADPDERTFYDSYSGNGIVFVDPPGPEMVSAARSSQYNYIVSCFSAFGSALWGASYRDPATGYAAHIDVDSWLDHHLLNVFSFNVDALRLSGYFFKDRDKKIEMGPLWDFDRSLGTSYSGDTRAYNPRLWRIQAGGDQGTDFFGDPNLLGVRWWQRLFTDPDFWQAWIDRWTVMRRGVLGTNHVFATIDSLAAQLQQAHPRQRLRWSYTSPRSGVVAASGYSYNFAGTFAGEIAFLKRWIADRTDFIDTNLLAAPVFSHAGGPINPGFQLTITAPTREANTTIYYTLDGTDPRLPGGQASPSALSHASPVTLTLSGNARVFARNWNPAHFNVTNYPGAVGGNPPISSPWSGPTVGTFVVAAPSLAVTEIMFHPRAATGFEDEACEFLELKNTGSAPVSLPGIHFTSGIEFAFSTTNTITTLDPGQYLVLVKDRAAFLARYPGVTNIAGVYSGSLDNGGEKLTLVGAVGEPILDFHYGDSWVPTADGLGFSLVTCDESAFASTWSDAASWRASTLLDGSPGRADPAPSSIVPVLINEALTHTDPPEVDTIELYNPTASPASVGGWFLSDDRTDPFKYRIPTNAVVPAGGFLLITENEFNSGTAGSFALSSLGEEIYLFSGDGTNLTGYRHGFTFGPQINGATFGRFVTSDGKEHFVSQQFNSLGATNAGPRVGPFIISEVMYAPPPFGLNADTLSEYVEIRNIAGQDAPLYDPLHPTNTWILDGAVQFSLPPGIVVPSGGYVVITSFDPGQDPVTLNWFRQRYNPGTNVSIFGPFRGHLANEGERVGLYLPDKPEIPPSPIAGFVPYVLAEEVHYSSSAPWPTNACATGNSLCRSVAIGFADDPANWYAGAPTPGRLNVGAIHSDSDADGLPDEWEYAWGFNPQSAEGVDGAAGDPDGDGSPNLQEYIAGTDPRDPLDFLHFDAVSVTGPYLALKFTRRAGRIYAVQACPSLREGQAWTALYDNLSGTADVTCFVPLDTGSVFYRLAVRLSP